MARMSLSQTWSVGPVALTISAVGDPVPPGWGEIFAPVVAAVEAALADLESDVYPIMSKGRLTVAVAVDRPEDPETNGDAS